MNVWCLAAPILACVTRSRLSLQTSVKRAITCLTFLTNLNRITTCWNSCVAFNRNIKLLLVRSICESCDIPFVWTVSVTKCHGPSLKSTINALVSNSVIIVVDTITSLLRHVLVSKVTNEHLIVSRLDKSTKSNWFTVFHLTFIQLLDAVAGPKFNNPDKSTESVFVDIPVKIGALWSDSGHLL